MNLKRKIVDTGERVADFFANDLQNIYYHHLFLANAKNNIGRKPIAVDAVYEKRSINWWKEKTGISINTLWHSFYSTQNGIKDERYIPENLYYSKIEPFFNRKAFAKSCDDKCYYSERFPENAVSGGMKRPKTIIRNISGLFFDEDFEVLTAKQAADLLSEQKDGYVIKESITGTGGNRIIFVEQGESKSVDEIASIFERYKKDFVVESLIEQCDEMKALNPSSINTIRFITFLDSDGVHLLSTVLRMGGINSRTDNFSTGGIACGVDENGKLKPVAYDQQYNRYDVHPNGCKFGGIQIPSYDAAVSLVKALHRRFGHFRIISWDIAIDASYMPTIIEFNLTPQSIDFHQINNGPLFGTLTEKVVLEVFGSR